MIPDDVVAENIKAQERMLELLRESVTKTGPKIVAERLGITEDELEHRLEFFGDLTMTELRYLASSTNTRIQYVWLEDNPKFEVVDNRDPECIKVWPECQSGEYSPSCCRFPKSCSAGNTWTRLISPTGSADETTDAPSANKKESEN